jgi:glycosyltransferase involved in cell wall biosynthesis
MKKIAFIVPRYHPIVGGTEMLAKNVIEFFASSFSCEISIITQPTPERIGIIYPHKIVEVYFNDAAGFNNHIKQANYDLCVFFNDLHTPYLNYYNLSCKKNICVLNLDEITYNNIDAWRLQGAISNLKRFDVVVTFTKDGIANKFLEENKIKNVYIPNFSRDVLATEKKIDFKNKLFGEDGDKKLVLYNAAIEMRKNQVTVLDMIAKNKKLQAYNWIFIGTTPDLRYLNQCNSIIKENNLEKNIKFIKNTTKTEMVDQLYQTCDVLALCSIAEGLPLVLVEAMSAKLPWVATPAGGVRGVLEDTKTGTVLKNINFSSDELVESIETSLNIDLNISRDKWYTSFNREKVCLHYNDLFRSFL